MKVEFSRQIFDKHSTVIFHENPPSGSGVVPYGRTDGRTERYMTKLIVAFCGFTNARKMSMPLKIAAYFALGLFRNFDQRWQGKVYCICYIASVRSYSFFVNSYTRWAIFGTLMRNIEVILSCDRFRGKFMLT